MYYINILYKYKCRRGYNALSHKPCHSFSSACIQRTKAIVSHDNSSMWRIVLQLIYLIKDVSNGSHASMTCLKGPAGGALALASSSAFRSMAVERVAAAFCSCSLRTHDLFAAFLCYAQIL